MLRISKVYPLLAVVLAASVSYGWGFHDCLDMGTPLVCATPLSTAMGSVWSLPAGGPAAIFLNPAELSTQEVTEVMVGSGWIQWGTDVLGEYEFQHSLTGTLPGPLTFAAGFELTEGMGMALGVCNVADFTFDGTNFVLLDLGPGLYRIQAVDNLNSRGSLWEINAGVGARVTDWLALGISGGVRNGSGSWEMEHNDLLGSEDSTYDGAWDETAACFHGGALISTEIGLLGISAVSGSDMYHDRIAAGFQHELSVINGPVGIEFDMMDASGESELSGRFFVAPSGMIRNVRSIYSIGFVQAADYKRTSTCLATGATVDFGALDMDMAISWRSRSRAGFSVPDPLVTEVNDSAVYYLLGLSWSPE